MSNSQPQNVLTPDSVAMGVIKSVSMLAEHAKNDDRFLGIYIERFGVIPEINGMIPQNQEAKANELDTPKT
jgi:hypothetical protein